MKQNQKSENSNCDSCEQCDPSKVRNLDNSGNETYSLVEISD